MPITFPFLTAIICSLNFDKIFTSEPTSETDGARIKIPVNFGIPIESIEISDSNESCCRPNEFRCNFISRIFKSA